MFYGPRLCAPRERKSSTRNMQKNINLGQVFTVVKAFYAWDSVLSPCRWMRMGSPLGGRQVRELLGATWVCAPPLAPPQLLNHLLGRPLSSLNGSSQQPPFLGLHYGCGPATPCPVLTSWGKHHPSPRPQSQYPPRFRAVSCQEAT